MTRTATCRSSGRDEHILIRLHESTDEHRVAEAFGKDNSKHVMEQLKIQGQTKAIVSVAKFKLHNFMEIMSIYIFFAPYTDDVLCVVRQRLEEELCQRLELDEVFAALGRDALRGQITREEFRDFLINVGDIPIDI